MDKIFIKRITIQILTLIEEWEAYLTRRYSPWITYTCFTVTGMDRHREYKLPNVSSIYELQKTGANIEIDHLIKKKKKKDFIDLKK